jgi:hypothetical protein
MGTNTPNSPSKGRKPTHTTKWIPNSMLLPFAHPASTHLWIILPLSHLTTLLNWTRSSSTPLFLLAMIFLKTLLPTAATPVLLLRTLHMCFKLKNTLDTIPIIPTPKHASIIQNPMLNLLPLTQSISQTQTRLLTLFYSTRLSL